MNAWRDLLTVVLGLCRVVAVMAAAVLGLPLAISRAILACVAAGWLPPKAAAAYLVPVLFFLGFIVAYPFVPALCAKTRLTEMLYRVLVGDPMERVERVMLRLDLHFPGEDWDGRGQAG